MKPISGSKLNTHSVEASERSVLDIESSLDKTKNTSKDILASLNQPESQVISHIAKAGTDITPHNDAQAPGMDIPIKMERSGDPATQD